ncbi:MAG: ISAs1 family transposase, partial [Mesorhizobium sp.]
RIETGAEVRVERRCYISSRILTAKTFAEAARAHWGIENGLHWVLDVQFKEDQSRLRRGHGATNMAMVRHLALKPHPSHARKTIHQRKAKTRNLGYRLPDGSSPTP